MSKWNWKKYWGILFPRITRMTYCTGINGEKPLVLCFLLYAKSPSGRNNDSDGGVNPSLYESTEFLFFFPFLFPKRAVSKLTFSFGTALPDTNNGFLTLWKGI